VPFDCARWTFAGDADADDRAVAQSVSGLQFGKRVVASRNRGNKGRILPSSPQRHPGGSPDCSRSRKEKIRLLESAQIHPRVESLRYSGNNEGDEGIRGGGPGEHMH
jgi:hypothetical protein